MKLVLSALAIAINIILGTVVDSLKIPLLFLDTLGTIYITSQIGLSYGILTGVCTNLVMGLFTGPTAIPFAIVNVATAVVVYLFSKKKFTIVKAVIAGLILAIVCPMLGTPIRLLLFGGFTGSGTDILIMAFKASGKEIFASTFMATVAGNFVDKIASCVLIAAVSKYLPSVYADKKAPKGALTDS